MTWTSGALALEKIKNTTGYSLAHIQEKPIALSFLPFEVGRIVEVFWRSRYQGKAKHVLSMANPSSKK